MIRRNCLRALGALTLLAGLLASPWSHARELSGWSVHAAADHGPLMRRMKPLYEALWSAKDPLSRQVVALILVSMATPTAAR